LFKDGSNTGKAVYCWKMEVKDNFYDYGKSFAQIWQNLDRQYLESKLKRNRLKKPLHFIQKMQWFYLLNPFFTSKTYIPELLKF
jgi:hypothetical protein